MKHPQEVLSAFTVKHQQLASALYQAVLCFVTFWCVVAIANYNPAPAIRDPTGSTWNRLLERICKLGGRKEDMDVDTLMVFLLSRVAEKLY
jgi:hypothetical protein